VRPPLRKAEKEREVMQRTGRVKDRGRLRYRDALPSLTSSDSRCAKRATLLVEEPATAGDDASAALEIVDELVLQVAESAASPTSGSVLDQRRARVPARHGTNRAPFREMSKYAEGEVIEEGGSPS
jgi:hypothetical protein